MKYILAPVCKKQAKVFRSSSKAVNGKAAKENGGKGKRLEKEDRTQLILTAVIVQFGDWTSPFVPAAYYSSDAFAPWFYDCLSRNILSCHSFWLMLTSFFVSVYNQLPWPSLHCCTARKAPLLMSLQTTVVKSKPLQTAQWWLYIWH